MDKQDRLNDLTARIKSTDLSQYFGRSSDKAVSKEYYHISSFHQGIYVTNHVSPWSKTAHNLEAQVVVIAQDWSSSDRLSEPVDLEVARLGYDKTLATNINLHRLLKQHLQIEFSATFAFNVFPFIKKGGLSARIPSRHIDMTAKEFAVSIVETISPKLAICLGLQTFNAMRKAVGLGSSTSLAVAVHQPFLIGNSVVAAVAHTGQLGSNSRNRFNKTQVDEDWANISKLV